MGHQLDQSSEHVANFRSYLVRQLRLSGIDLAIVDACAERSTDTDECIWHPGAPHNSLNCTNYQCHYCLFRAPGHPSSRCPHQSIPPGLGHPIPAPPTIPDVHLWLENPPASATEDAHIQGRQPLTHQPVPLYPPSNARPYLSPIDTTTLMARRQDTPIPSQGIFNPGEIQYTNPFQDRSPINWPTDDRTPDWPPRPLDDRI